MSRKLLKLDLDGCVVDFVRGAFKEHGRAIPYKDVQWNFDKVIFPADVSKFWDPLGYEFWANLSWTPQGCYIYQNLLEIVKPENIIVATSPCDTEGCVEGKIAWIKKNMPDLKRRFSITTVKFEEANPNQILLDDSDENITKFIANGGEGFTWPQPWNKRSKDQDGEGNVNLDEVLADFKERWLDL